MIPFMHLERHVGILAVELADRIRQQRDARDDRPDGQHAADALALLPHLLQRVGKLAHEPLRALEQQLAGGGQPQAASRAVEQHDAELLLHLPQLAAERRLLHVQRARRARNLAFAGDRHEVIQLAHIHTEDSFRQQWKSLAAAGDCPECHTRKVWRTE